MSEAVEVEEKGLDPGETPRNKILPSLREVELGTRHI